MKDTIDRYFDMLFISLEEEDWTSVTIYLSKLSPYSSSFNADEMEQYKNAEYLCNHVGTPKLFIVDDDYEEVSEFQEWYDFDPDC